MDLKAIAHEFMIKYGCAPGEPSTEQVRVILDQVAELEGRVRRPSTEQEIRDVVHRVVPSAGKYKYGAMSYQNMRDLLLQAQGLLKK